MRKHYRRLRLLLGDQLDSQHSWFDTNHSDTLYIIAEMRQETGYTHHHVQKISAFFAAMACFAKELQQQGHQVLHLTLEDTETCSDFPQLLAALARRFDSSEVEYQLPDEYRLQEQLASLDKTPDWPVNTRIAHCESEHFLLSREELPLYFKQGKHQKMEFFYRKMRKRFGWLMDDEEPEGGQWNFDTDNRSKLNKTDIAAIPAPLLFANDVRPILDRLAHCGIEHFGRAQHHLACPVTRAQALELLDDFCLRLLPHFGRFQDAMTCSSPHSWSLYHARLSFAINVKLLRPAEVIDRAIAQYRASQRKKAAPDIDIAQIEGFVRQIAGWREYMRGVYWANMPGYASLNKLTARRELPAFFWTGETKMHCLAQAIGQSLEHAYAHHIQRLMITGNFCLLAGIDPAQVDAWYLGIYSDAIEWVELPNTRGMSQFADGGIVGTKPYAASGNYVNKMSDYCKSCYYKANQKTGELACPLNTMYWHFMLRHRDLLGNNPRTAMPYRNWDKRAAAAQQEVLDEAEARLENLHAL